MPRRELDSEGIHWGVSDPYEASADEVTINTGELSPEEAAREIMLHLEREGFIGVNGASA
ncbi:MAG: hypothetical protein WCF26_08560 [Candidatus Sulfotelmatobacter sp.]